MLAEEQNQNDSRGGYPHARKSPALSTSPWVDTEQNGKEREQASQSEGIHKGNGVKWKAKQRPSGLGLIVRLNAAGGRRNCRCAAIAS